MKPLVNSGGESFDGGTFYCILATISIMRVMDSFLGQVFLNEF
ncbi:hypothetical protein [Candidatus Megaera venefica]|nr:hypothetical protein [Candidatus Megaera venefica]